MLRVITKAAILFVLVTATAQAAEPPGREIACKTAENAKSCYWLHGRLEQTNGNPSFRLWPNGTNRLLGIYSGPVAFMGRYSKYALDNEGPELPPNVQHALWGSVKGSWSNQVFADFDVCPLAPESPGVMQPACIESAKNIVVRKDR